MISQRTVEADARAVPGHWEGDLILGLGSSAIGTLVERTTRLTMLLHLPRIDGHGAGPSIKNGPALAGHGAEAVRNAIARTITALPQELRRSLTWDQGAEMAQHARLKIGVGVQVYFCDPKSPWHRGSNENTNRLLRTLYSHLLDGNDIAALDQVFAADIEVSVGTMHGIDAIRAELTDAFAQYDRDDTGRYPVMHAIANHWIRVTGPDTAEGRCYLLDFETASKPDSNPLLVLGLYTDEYRGIDGAWRITRSRLEIV